MMMKNKHYMPHKGSWRTVIVAVSMAIVVSVAITGCDDPTRQEKFELGVINHGVPSGATNIEYVNGQWYTFEWKGQCFLAMQYWRQASVTKVNC